MTTSTDTRCPRCHGPNDLVGSDRWYSRCMWCNRRNAQPISFTQPEGIMDMCTTADGTQQTYADIAARMTCCQTAEIETCEDCEQAPASVTRIDSDGGPYRVCAGCDPGPGCRPIIDTERYSNGRRGYFARCPQCGWRQLGTADSDSGPRGEAKRHAAA